MTEIGLEAIVGGLVELLLLVLFMGAMARATILATRRHSGRRSERGG